LQSLPDSLRERSLKTSEGTEKLFERRSKDLKTMDFFEPDEMAEIVRAEFEERLAKALAGRKRAVRENRERCFTISRAIRPDIDGSPASFGKRGNRSRWKANMDRPVSVSPDEDGS
jgi:hypothetical protein